MVLIAAVAALADLALFEKTCAASAGPHHSFLGGPWEIVVKTRLDGEGLRFPLTVSDENKPQKIDKILPVKGTPIEIRLENYVPDLKWETDAVRHPGGEIAGASNSASWNVADPESSEDWTLTNRFQAS